LIVAEIDEIHDVVADGIGAPTVAIDLRSHAERGRRDPVSATATPAVMGEVHDPKLLIC